MPRAHLYLVAQDTAGNALENSTIRVLQPGTENPLPDPFYATDIDVAAMDNPFITASGLIEFYINTPQRVRIGVTPPGAAERFFEDIDVGSVGGGGGGGDSDHVGIGANSTRVGLDALAEGPSSLAIAQQASAGGDASVAAGFASSALGLHATAVGSSTVAGGERAVAAGRAAVAPALGSVSVGADSSGSNVRSTALGDTAIANSQRSTALGSNSNAGHENSTAVGSEAVTTEANQIMLGTLADVAEAPGGYVLEAGDGKRARLIMLPDGNLSTLWHIPGGTTNLLPIDEQGFEGGIGGWTVVSGVTIAQDATYVREGVNSLKVTLDSAGAGSIRSSKVVAMPGATYVGQTQAYFHAGEMTDGLDGTCWLEFYDDAEVMIGSAVVGRWRNFFADVWVHLDARAIAPPTAASVALLIGLPTGGGQAGEFFYLDQCGLYQAAPAP